MACLVGLAICQGQPQADSLTALWSSERSARDSNDPAEVLGTIGQSAFLLLQTKQTGGDGSFGWGPPYFLEELSMDGFRSVRKEEVLLGSAKQLNILEFSWAGSHINVLYSLKDAKDKVLMLRRIGSSDLKPIGGDLELLRIPEQSMFHPTQYVLMRCDERGNIIVMASYFTSKDRVSQRSSVFTFDAQGGSRREFRLKDLWPCQDAYDQAGITDDGALVFIGNRAAPPPEYVRNERCLIMIREGAAPVIAELPHTADDPGIPCLFRSSRTGRTGVVMCGMEVGRTRLQKISVQWVNSDGSLAPGLQAPVDPVMADELGGRFPAKAGHVNGYTPKVVEDSVNGRLYVITELMVRDDRTGAIMQEGVITRATVQNMRSDIHALIPQHFTADILISSFGDGSFSWNALVKKAQFGNGSKLYLGYAFMAHRNGLTLWYNANATEAGDRPGDLGDLSYERADTYVACARIGLDGEARLSRTNPPNADRVFRMRGHFFRPVPGERLLVCFDEAPAVDSNIGRGAKDIHVLGQLQP